MVTPSGSRPPLRRAVLLMTASSFLVPAAGILTQPILAQGLGVAGRGQLAAALAPAALVVAIAALGLPEALTFYLAKHPSVTRPALLCTTVITSILGATCLVAVLGFLPLVSNGDVYLGYLIVVATVVSIPTLVVGGLRGAAAGRQMWKEIAIERLFNALLRIMAFCILWFLGSLSVFSALLTMCLSPVVSGIVYWRLLVRPPHDKNEPPAPCGPLFPLISYGRRIWLGAVASMLLARVGQILMAPLSSIEDLGLYSVAITISDVPLIVALAISGALHGVNSRSNDAGQVTLTSRLTLVLALLGCIILGATLPVWIGPLFGEAFSSATLPTLMLLASSLICIPGLIAATGISVWGRPGQHSIGLGIALIVNLSIFVVLVPLFGVIGACWAGIAGNIVFSCYLVTSASRVMQVAFGDFLVIRRSDVDLVWRECVRLLRKGTRRNLGIGR